MRIEKGIPLILIKQILLVLIGISGGIFISAGLYAFIAMVGVLTRLAVRTKTASHINLYETIVILGATFGNVSYILNWRIPIGRIGLIVYGICSGIFIGCLAVALAEVVDVIPVFSRRVKLKRGMVVILSIMGIAKAIGTIFQFCYS